MTFSLERKFEIWDDGSGSHVEVGPDRDGLDLIEIRQYEADAAKCHTRMTFTKEQARLICQALGECSR